jgi:hypothetical protein
MIIGLIRARCGLRHHSCRHSHQRVARLASLKGGVNIFSGFSPPSSDTFTLRSNSNVQIKSQKAL